MVGDTECHHRHQPLSRRLQAVGKVIFSPIRHSSLPPHTQAQAHLLLCSWVAQAGSEQVSKGGKIWAVVVPYLHFAVIFVEKRVAGVFVFLLFGLVWFSFLSSPWHCSVRRHATAHAHFSWAKLRASTWKFFFSSLHRAHRLLSFSRNRVGAPMFSAFWVGPLLGCLSPLSLPWKRKKSHSPASKL